MKIYTKTGDGGETGLYGGQRTSKAGLRISACGTVDEASSFLGLARAQLADTQLNALAARLQSLLFELGADLATPLSARQRGRLAPITAADVDWLEARIDEIEAELVPLTSFILPGGDAAGATLHVARSVVRRAERLAVGLLLEDEINKETVRFLNRLSDLLFCMARLANSRGGVSETRWMAREAGG